MNTAQVVLSASMKKIMLLSISVLAMSGCAQRVWMKDGATAQEFTTDRYGCERDMRQSGYYGSGLAGALNAQSFQNECMNARGYSLVEKQTPDQEILSKTDYAVLVALLAEGPTFDD